MFHRHETELNALLDFSGQNNPQHFSVTKFIREVRPRSREQLAAWMNQELMRKCSTSLEGIAYHCWKNQADIFQNAYDALKTTVHHLVTLGMDEVYDYVRDVFVERTWTGFEREADAEKLLSKKLRSGYSIYGDPRLDTDYAVDLCIRDAQENILCAIQVKPLSYKYMSDTHHNKLKDKKKNERFTKEFGIEVDYVYYDFKTLEWQQWPDFLKLVGQRHREYDALATSK
jgi:hypothetical protein